MTPDVVHRLIFDALHDSDAVIDVDGEDGRHFFVTIVSSVFCDMTRLARHRFVLNTLSTYFSTDALHALSLRLFSPSEWEKRVLPE